MKQFTLLNVLMVLFTNISAQSTTASVILEKNEVAGIFSPSVRTGFKINLPILRVYKYTDQSGMNYCVLTESRDEIISGKDTINKKIKAINFKVASDSLLKTWEMNDNISTNEEKTIWFWTNYIELKDLDGDGLVDPVIIYGSSGYNGYDDGRVKFIIYHKGKKVAIRHQNAITDDQRELQVENGFYSLPQSVQSAVKQKMLAISKNDQSIFPYGWESAMTKKKTMIRESKATN